MCRGPSTTRATRASATPERRREHYRISIESFRTHNWIELCASCGIVGSCVNEQVQYESHEYYLKDMHTHTHTHTHTHAHTSTHTHPQAHTCAPSLRSRSTSSFAPLGRATTAVHKASLDTTCVGASGPPSRDSSAVAVSMGPSGRVRSAYGLANANRRIQNAIRLHLRTGDDARPNTRRRVACVSASGMTPSSSIRHSTLSAQSTCSESRGHSASSSVRLTREVFWGKTRSNAS